MGLDEYWDILPSGGKIAMAKACGVTVSHLGEIARRHRAPSSFRLVQAIEVASKGHVTISDWPKVEQWVRK